MEKTFNIWKKAGKPTPGKNPTRAAYSDARRNLQRLVRHEATLLNIKLNNNLMHLNNSDRSKIFAIVKKARGDYSNTMTNVLQTPVGTYYGEDVLEGFAADAEHLGKSNEGATFFDQGF